MRRLLPAALGLGIALIPLFPALITLTGAGVPGVSLLPHPAVVALFGAAVCLGAYGALMLSSAPPRPLPTAAGLALLPPAAVVCALTGFRPAAGAAFILLLTLAVVWHATIVRFAGEPSVERAVYGCFLASGAAASIVAIAMVLTRMPVALFALEHGRATGTFIVPGELAAYLIVYVPVAIAVAATAKRRATRVAAALATAIAITAFGLTFSRAGWLGMAAALACFLAMQRRRGSVRAAVAVVTAALILLAFVFNAHHDPSENFTRLSIWRTAGEIIVRFPLTGVGPFDFASLYGLFRPPGGEPLALHAHSMLLTIAAELGVVGTIALALAAWRFAVVFRDRLARAAVRPTVAIAIVAGLAGTAVQGLIDTLSIVIFALWPTFTALAIAALPAEEPSARAPRPPGRRRPQRRAALLAVAGAIAIVLAYVQVASDALYAFAGARGSFPSRLSPQLGEAMYGIAERIAPLPFVEATLADAALRRADADGARGRVSRLPRGPVRSELEARIALADHQPGVAVVKWLEAGDDAALQREVERRLAAHDAGGAYALEARIRDRLGSAETRPNALADSWWRLGHIALALGQRSEARDDFERASSLAPLNTKYLLDAGLLALEDHDAARAAASFARAADADPSDADAVAALGLAALQRGDVNEARALDERAARIDKRSRLRVRLEQLLGSRRT